MSLSMGHLSGFELAGTSAAAAMRAGKEPDYDVFGPGEAIVVGKRYVTNLPRSLVLTDGLMLSAPIRTSAEVVVRLWIGGVLLTASDVTLSTAGDTTLIPLSGIAYDFRQTPLPARARLEVEIVSAPSGAYVAYWYGLKLALLGVPAVASDLSAMALGRLPDLWRWPVVRTVHPVIGSGGLPLAGSAGSGIVYWPTRQTVLILDNNPQRIVEFGLADGLPFYRTITLSGFSDTEAIACIHSETGVFAIADEGTNTIELIQIPLDGAVTITKGAGGWLATRDPSITAGANLGIEALTYDPATNFLYFATQEADSDHGGVWSVFKMLASGGPCTALFSLNTVFNGLASQVNDMCLTAAGTLLFATRTAYAGATSDKSGRLIETTVSGRLIQQTTIADLPCLEGVALDPTDSRLFLVSEKDITTGCYFQEWKRPVI